VCVHRHGNKFTGFLVEDSTRGCYGSPTVEKTTITPREHP
jgi:hypothetical protein